MPSVEAHAAMMVKLLPEGECWPTTTDGTGPYDRLIRGLCGEPARADDDALIFLDDYYPDTATSFLADWERVLGLSRGVLSTTDRRKQIVAKLAARGYINRADIEIAMQQRRSDTTLRLLHLLHPQFVCGSGAGSQCNGPQWPATWTCEYMTNVLDRAPDAVWTGASTITANFAQSPRTLAQTAQKIEFGSSGPALLANAVFSGTADNNIVQTDVWLRSASGTSSVQIYYQLRDGSTNTPTNLVLQECWAKVSYRAGVGAGASAPRPLLSGNAQTIYLSYAMAGIVDPVFEAWAPTITPINTTGEFAIVGENP